MNLALALEDSGRLNKPRLSTGRRCVSTQRRDHAANLGLLLLKLKQPDAAIRELKSYDSRLRQPRGLSRNW